MSYQLHCPNCATAIPQDNINIQKTIAVCPNCSSVFNFEDKVASTQKIKRRKSKKPDVITQTETDDRLTLSKPLVQSTSYKVLSGIGGFLILGFTMLILQEFSGDVNTGRFIVQALFLLTFFASAFSMLGSLFMKQIVDLSTDVLAHRIALGLPFYTKTFNVNEIDSITVTEMNPLVDASSEGRYKISIHKHNGGRNTFMQDLPEETAFYIHQALTNYLQADDTANDHMRLTDEASHADDAMTYEQVMSADNLHDTM